MAVISPGHGLYKVIRNSQESLDARSQGTGIVPVPRSSAPLRAWPPLPHAAGKAICGEQALLDYLNMEGTRANLWEMEAGWLTWQPPASDACRYRVVQLLHFPLMPTVGQVPCCELAH